jgi:hypothetical protein
MKHLLDYDLLQDYGFIWVSKCDLGSNRDVVAIYLKEEDYGTDIHDFKPIVLQMIPNINVNTFWTMRYMTEEKHQEVIFSGIIKSKTALKHILESCVIFKPKKQPKKT